MERVFVGIKVVCLTVAAGIVIVVGGIVFGAVFVGGVVILVSEIDLMGVDVVAIKVEIAVVGIIIVVVTTTA